jgi:hypothetical protein
MAGLVHAPGPGDLSDATQRQAADDERRVFGFGSAATIGYAGWDGTLLARAIGNISKHQIWRLRRRHEIPAGAAAPLIISTDPASPSRRQTLSGCMCSRRRTPWCCRSTRMPHIQGRVRISV